MEQQARRIELNTWPRAEHFQFYSATSQPFYSLSFQLDVTKLLAFARKEALSFYYALVFLCTRAINETEAFSYTIRKDAVWKLSGRAPSFTDLHKGSELFHIVSMPLSEEMLPLQTDEQMQLLNRQIGETACSEMKEAVRRFCREAKEKSEAQQSFLVKEEESDELIYFSCLPWLSLTALTNERDFSADDSIPRIAWGKYETDPYSGRVCLNLSMEVNHRLIDGIHLGQFAERLQLWIDSLTMEQKND